MVARKKPIRIAATSDLHLDFSGELTPERQVEEVARQMAEAQPDAVLLGGDLACSSAGFFRCVEIFAALEKPVGVVPGNHDLWADEAEGLSSETLFFRTLPALTAKAGGTWLENHDLVLERESGRVVICGSTAWYDYSAVDPRFSDVEDAEFARRKAESNADAWRMDWNRTDPDFAQHCRHQVLTRLQRQARRDDVEDLVLLTHVPIFEEQMVRKEDNPQWGFSNAYFGHLTLGESVRPMAKLRAVISGHTHQHRHCTLTRDPLAPLQVWVVDSDYGAPNWHLIEID
jgi:predicted MPP superfamily phosphohydrolase